MSADNWAICPKCKRNDEAEMVKRWEKAKSAYGKIPPDEYLVLLQKANQPIKEVETLREDYELGIDSNGLFNISYSAHCDKCGLKFTHNYKENISI